MYMTTGGANHLSYISTVYRGLTTSVVENFYNVLFVFDFLET